jgi:hypothetical protein
MIGFFGYIAAAVVIADFVQTMHWAIQAIYFVLAGILWALPARWLMFWSVGKR